MIDCHKCKHYYVTWDKHFPHGCKAMKFKSKQFPSTVVFVSSNIECLLFKKKKRKTTSKGKEADQAADKKIHQKNIKVREKMVGKKPTLH